MTELQTEVATGFMAYTKSTTCSTSNLKPRIVIDVDPKIKPVKISDFDKFPSVLTKAKLKIRRVALTGITNDVSRKLDTHNKFFSLPSGRLAALFICNQAQFTHTRCRARIFEF